jgi:two-component system cell cycle sensor histidine kinase PleC
MLQGPIGGGRANSLMSDYVALLGDAILRHRTRTAEHAARIQTELANKVKSEFISNMSHELRTPLNTVIGFSKILSEHNRRRLQDEEVVEYAHLIHDAAQHLLSVINDILDISKLQSGKYSLDAAEVEIGELLAGVREAFKPQAETAGVAFEFHADADLPNIRGDQEKLRQVVGNLVSNAIKFTQSGGTISLAGVRLNDGGLAIVIRDTGVGMSAGEIEVALTPFGQVDGSRARWREGTGLGLPIARALVELHGGRIEINSEKTKGTEVIVYLPSRHAVSVVAGRDAFLGAGFQM